MSEAVKPSTDTETSDSDSIYIDGRNYTTYLQEGVIVKDTKTEELDSITIVLTNMPKKDFEPFSIMKYTPKNGTERWFCLNSYVPTLIKNKDTIETTPRYSYTIQGVSMTKLLERVILPNLTITKPLSTTATTKTIYNYINNVILPYVNGQYGFTVSISDDFKTLTQNIHCNEICWNTPNAKQVINDLLSMIPNNPCLCTLGKNYELGYISLAETGNEITNANVIDEEDYEQMQNYANNIVVDAKNVSAEDKYSITPYLSGRCDESQLTQDNVYFKIPNAKLDKVIGLIIPVTITIGTGDSATTKAIELDIGSHIIEKTIYDSLKVTAQASTSTSITWSEYKRNFLYFEQGGDAIRGLYYTDSSFGGASTDYAINCIVIKELARQGYSYSSYSIGTFKTLKFICKYYSYGDLRMYMYRNNELSTNASMIATQNQQYINYTSLTKMQRENVNRMGNDLKKYTAIFKSDELPELGDTVDDYILAQREIAYYDDYAIMNGVLSKDFVQRNNFIGINARTRYSQLALEKDSIVRETVYKFVVKFNTEEKHADSDGYDANCLNFIVKPYDCYVSATESTLRKYWCNAILMQCNSKNFLLPADTYYGDRQVTITGQCYDNAVVGMQRASSDGKTVQTYMKYAKYVDSNGEASYFVVRLIFDLTSNADTDEYPVVSNFSTLISGDTDWGFYESGYIYKDNKETLKFTYQIDFESESDDLIIGDYIGYYNGLITKANYKIKYCATKTLDKTYPVIDDNWVEYNYSPMVDEDNMFISIHRNAEGEGNASSDSVDSDMGTTGSWVMCDSSNHIVFGCNAVNGKLNRIIYFGMEERKK